MTMLVRMMQRLLFVAVLGLFCSQLPLISGVRPLKAGEPDAGRIVFRGRVLDHQGKPVAGAAVRFYQLDISESDILVTAERTGEEVTSSDGVFSFAASKLWEGHRQGSIIARKEGLALGWVVWLLRQDEQADIVLGEPKDLRGLVVDQGGRPVGDARVGVAVGMIGAIQDERIVTSLADPRLLTVRTDRDGGFVFADMPADATFEFFAEKPGYGRICTLDPLKAASSGRCQFAAGQADIKLTLPPEARIEGKVVDKTTGQPVGGARILARRFEEEDPFGFGSDPVASGADGTFTIASLAPGAYTVRLIPKAQRALDQVAEPVEVSLKAGETVRDVCLALTAGSLVEVVVKEQGSGAPIEKARISVIDPARGRGPGSVTDAAGIARFRLTPGTYQLMRIYQEGYEYLNQQETFTIADGQTRRFERVLTSLPSLTGVVYDDAGKPLEGVALQIMPVGRESATSDAQGQFRVKWDKSNWGQNPPALYLLARHAERNLAAAELAGEAGSRMEVKLRPGVTLAGQVVDANGKPIAGANILVMFWGANWRSTILSTHGTKTDTQGRYEVGAMPSEQRYDIHASGGDYGYVRTEADTAGTTGNRVAVNTVTLPLANLAVSGQVVDVAGTPIPRANVSCYAGGESGQPNRHVQTDAKGRFTLERVCAGPIQISVSGRAGSAVLRGSVQTEGGATDVQIVLTQANTGGSRVIPRRPASLKGRPLPDLKTVGIELPADAQGKMLLVCFWDMDQRPSRHFVTQLAGRAAQLAEKGVVIVAVQAGKVDQNVLAEWVKTARIPFAAGSIGSDAEKARLEWGVASLPHLILTDRRHVVVADGFGLGELEKKIEEASGR